MKENLETCCMDPVLPVIEFRGKFCRRLAEHEVLQAGDYLNSRGNVTTAESEFNTAGWIPVTIGVNEEVYKNSNLFYFYREVK